MKLVKETNSILFKKCDPFDFNEPVMDPYELVEGLHKIRKDGKGIGLAAPQVGLATQVLVIGMETIQLKGYKIMTNVFSIQLLHNFLMRLRL